jgi:hypothetical protein
MVVVQPPRPGNVQIEGRPESDGMSIHQKRRATVSAEIWAIAGTDRQVALVVHVSKNSDFANYERFQSGYGPSGRVASVEVDGLSPNSRYYIRVISRQGNIDNIGLDPGETKSKTSKPNFANFWTERHALAPKLTQPAENAVVIEGNDVLVKWQHRDADTDPEDPQKDAQVQWRVAGTSTEAPGPWVGIGAQYPYPTGVNVRPTPGAFGPVEAEQYTISKSFLSGGAHHEWRVRTRDVHTSNYGPWSVRSFFVLAATRPPLPLSPTGGEAVTVDGAVTFEWQHRDPGGDPQINADIRYRADGAEDWTTLNGGTEPGASQTWTLPEETFQEGFRYEWQVRTYATPGNPSGWSRSVFFWAIRTPGTGVVEIPDDLEPQGALGCGEYRAFIYDRGGRVYRGEIKPIGVLRWRRLRDDISNCVITTSGFDESCCELLSTVRSWAHEIVLFRNGVRVWEGPITRIGYTRTGVQIEARDVMVYVYRRIMRQGYNDNFRRSAQGIIGSRSVVDRAAIIIANALAPNDPNVLPWLTRYDFPDDARESRIIGDWVKTAWEEVDDLAAHAGLDYTVSGRRIILFDTHRAIGLLPEMTDGDFFESPVITEYGMSAANVFGVTNNAGLYGVAQIDPDDWGDLGPIEMLASEYGESSVSGVPEAFTPEQQAQKREVLSEQAERNISGRWPTPLVARVPDNARVSPEATVGINQLIPGAHVPLRVETPCRSFAQMQKLDSMSVEVTGDGDEKVRVVMSPAGKDDDDSEVEVET